MTDLGTYRDIGVSLDGHVATVEIRRPPHNFFDSDLIAQIGEAFERLDDADACRSIVLCAEGRSFCAGADFSKRMAAGTANDGTRSGAGDRRRRCCCRWRGRWPTYSAARISPA